MGKPIIQKIKVIGSKGEREVDTLFDTGSHHSHIKREIANAIEPMQVKKRIIEASVHGWQDAEFDIVVLEVKTDGGSGIIPFLLRDFLPPTFDMILGTNAMNLLEIELHLEEGTVKFGKCPTVGITPIFSYENRNILSRLPKAFELTKGRILPFK